MAPPPLARYLLRNQQCRPPKDPQQRKLIAGAALYRLRQRISTIHEQNASYD